MQVKFPAMCESATFTSMTRGMIRSPICRTVRAFKFLFTAPLILLILVILDWMTSPGEWWVQWAGLGIGIVWVSCLVRVLQAVTLVGGIAALGSNMLGRQGILTH